MSEATFRLARLGEDAAIVDFINGHFDMRLPLLNRPELYRHYYAGLGGVPQFAVAEQDGEYLSACGYIRASAARRPDVWVSVWVARKGHNGVGLELMNALPGLLRCEVLACVRGLVRVMEKVHAARALHIRVDEASATFFAGEEQDLQEMLGNLLDNACKWARGEVVVTVTQPGGERPARLCVRIEDDGPGIDAARLTEVVARGARLDESVPGSGLGLAIVQELAGLYGGSLQLRRAPAGGLAAVLDLPAV